MGVFDAIGNAATTVYTTERGIQAAKEQLKNEQAWASEEALANRLYQTSEREASQDWNYQMWNETNEYNSASSQYQRLIDAGMNPVTAMSALSGVDQSASSLVTSPQSGSMASSPGSIAGTIGQLIGNSANNFWSNELSRQQVRGQEIQNQFAPSINEKTLKKMDADINEAVARKDLTEVQATQIRELLPALKDKTETEVKEIKSKISNLEEQTKLITAQIETENKKQENLEASTNLMGTQAEKTTSENLLLQQEKIKAEWENFYRTEFNIDPNSDIGKQLVTLALSGKSGPVLTNLFKFADSALDHLEPRFSKFMYKVFPKLSDNLGIPHPINGAGSYF